MTISPVPTIFLILLAAGCMTERVQPVAEYPAVPEQPTFLVREIMYDDRGRPLFGDRIGSRPGTAGERFTVIHAVNDRPSRACVRHIGVTSLP
jgi:hypothetical protein